MPPFHRRLLDAGRGPCREYGLFLAGGYALKAHGLVGRPSGDLNLAAALAVPVAEAAGVLAGRYRGDGLTVGAGPGDDWFARMTVTDPVTAQSCDVDLMRTALTVSPVTVDGWPVVGFDDAVGLKMRAVHDRCGARDLLDVAALAGQYGFERLEWLGRAHQPEFSLRRLADRLETAVLRHEDAESYGLDEEEVRRALRFAAEWAHDINMRLYEDAAFEADGLNPDL
ncbi:MAG TPA: nucleotidyl transferase AbiEii/AbiGii toxin family protein [Thermomonospora sp.]|nr:nucleotidyl transferase AbiEii/AbiGii toxin family protein [Thermomonospora sp.]